MEEYSDDFEETSNYKRLETDSENDGKTCERLSLPPSTRERSRKSKNSDVSLFQNSYLQELELKDKQLKEERLQRQQLESVLSQLQHKLISGGETVGKAEKQKILAQRKQKELKKAPPTPTKDEDLEKEKYMLPTKEIFRIKKLSKFDENNNEWHIKPFVLQNKQILFPKLPKSQVYETIQSDLRNRTLVFSKAQNAPILEEEDDVNENLRNLQIQEKEIEAKEPEDFDIRPITSGHNNREFNSRRLHAKILDSRREEIEKRIFLPLRK